MSWAENLQYISGGVQKYQGIRAQKAGEREARLNRRLQQQALQQGIQWKVKDAELAGIHPVFALGASTNMPAPITTDFGGYERIAEATARNAMAIGDRVAQQRAQAQADALAAAQIRESESRTALNLQEVSDRARAAQAPRYSSGVAPSSTTLPPAVPWKTSPTARAQYIQDEYGDMVEWPYGAARLLYDLFLNIGEAARSRKGAVPAGRFKAYPQDRRYYGSEAR